MHFFQTRRDRSTAPVQPIIEEPSQPQGAYNSYNTTSPTTGCSTTTSPLGTPAAYSAPNGIPEPHFLSSAYIATSPYQQQGAHAPHWASASTLSVMKPVAAGGRVEEQTWGQDVYPDDEMAAIWSDMLYQADWQSHGEGETYSGTQFAESTRNIASRDKAMSPRTNKVAHKPTSKSEVVNVGKSWLYQNSRLPPGMLPFKMYMPTWVLVCRAAQASLDVYTRPPKNQREYYTDPDPVSGTKATIVQSQLIDDRKLVVVAIRGSQWNKPDWTMNLRQSATAPINFLDDPGNACHGGFLEAARAMVTPIAAQLRRLIADDPSLVTSSLLFTGHSAGGAVASLLHSHMLARTVQSDLTSLTGLFKRVHCVTFGTPPLSLLPLQTARRNEKNQFLSFVNEGDPIVRADRQYFTSLVKLYTASAPNTRPSLRERMSSQHLRKAPSPSANANRSARWPVPDATLSNAGRLVLLRDQPTNRKHIEAVQLTDGELRGVLFGDFAMHAMVLYKKRVDELAFAAMSGRDAG